MALAKSKPYSLNKNKYLLDPEFECLDEILTNFIDSSPRDCLLLRLALLTGARAQEILNIKIKDLNIYEKTVFIHGLKNSNDRELPLPPDIFKRLLRVVNFSEGLSQQELDQFVFPISYNRFRQIWQFYRPCHKKLHSLRHTFAIRLYKKTKDLRLVQFALGHRNITNTMIYADYIYSQQELKKLLL